MHNVSPFYLNLGISLCRLFSNPVAAFHSCIVQLGISRIPRCIHNAPGGSYQNLRNIWFSRLFRKVVSVLVRTPLRNETLRMVKIGFAPAETGCVITLCHTPWTRLLVQWCLKNDYALVVTANNWNRRTNMIRRNGKGFAELRQITRHLKSGGRVIIMADVFNNLENCSANFLEKDCNISLLPARLASIANVPLYAAVPELRDERIHIYEGPRFDINKCVTDPSVVMRAIMNFYESEIRRNPSIWSVFVQGSLSKYQRDQESTAIV